MSQPLVRYLLAATFGRCADAAAGIAIILVATDPATGLADGARIGGLLAAALTVPHLAGPLLAERLDRTGDSRRLLATAFVIVGVMLGVAAVSLGRTSILLVAAAMLFAGLAGPLLTGGMSSLIPDLVGNGGKAMRRAQGWDSTSYGLAGTAGPALVGALAALISPVGAMLALSFAAFVGAIMVLRLPTSSARTNRRGDISPVGQTLRLIVRDGPLRRVLLSTMAFAVGMGGLPVAAVTLGEELRHSAASGALLTMAYGLGTLLGSIAVTARPIRGEPETLTARHVAVMGIALAACGLAPNYPLAFVAFFATGLNNAWFVVATFAARTDYAPPNARAQVFVTNSALKVVAGSVGTALAGILIVQGPRAVLGIGVAVVVVSTVGWLVDRAVAPPRPSPLPNDAQLPS